MEKVFKKKRKTPITKVAVKLACACPSNCGACSCVAEKPAATPRGQFDADVCAGLYYLDKAFNK